MNYAALLGSSVWALLRNKMRSVLTVLGITIGIARGHLRRRDRQGRPGPGRAAAQQPRRQLRLDRGRRARGQRRAHRHARDPDADARRRGRDQGSRCRSSRAYRRTWMARRRSSTATRTGSRITAGVSPEYFDIKRWVVDAGRRVHAGRRRSGGRRLRDRTDGARSTLRRRQSDRQGDARSRASLARSWRRFSPKGCRCPGRIRTTRSSCPTRPCRRRSRASPGSTTSCAPRCRRTR